MFVDEVKISVTAGKGGDGCVSFRREKYVPKGGPDGGNGGKGGNIIFQAVDNIHTLYDFRSTKNYKADKGRPGQGNNRNGHYGADLILKVPIGTQIRNADTGKVFADLARKNEKITIAQGGRGGKGNAGFVSSIRQAPDFAEKGDIGESFNLELELKLVADVALVGYPSVGKSTFISVVSNAKPKVAEYHFTTLVPNLGVAKVDNQEIIFVDVPGLIEGASEGKGLGHTFLRHIERARFVLHLIDVTSNTPLQDFEVIRSELKKFSRVLEQKPFLPVFTKIDLTDNELEEFLMSEFEKEYKLKPYKVSAATHEGIEGLLRYILSQLPEREEEIEVLEVASEEDTEKEVLFQPAKIKSKSEKDVEIIKSTHWWELKNERLEQMVRQTEIEKESARERIYDVLKKWHVLKKLTAKGAIPGDKIKIGEHFWEFRG